MCTVELSSTPGVRHAHGADGGHSIPRREQQLPVPHPEVRHCLRRVACLAEGYPLYCVSQLCRTSYFEEN